MCLVASSSIHHLIDKGRIFTGTAKRTCTFTCVYFIKEISCVWTIIPEAQLNQIRCGKPNFRLWWALPPLQVLWDKNQEWRQAPPWNARVLLIGSLSAIAIRTSASLRGPREKRVSNLCESWSGPSWQRPWGKNNGRWARCTWTASLPCVASCGSSAPTSPWSSCHTGDM